MVINDIDRLLAPQFSLEANGFEHKTYNKNFNIAFFYKKMPERNLVISYQYSGFTHRAIEEVSLGDVDFRYWIDFTAVSTILSRFASPAFKNDTFLINNSNIIVNHPDFIGQIPSGNRILLYKHGNVIEANLSIAVRELTKFIHHGALAFFRKVENLQVVNDEIINRIPQKELSVYIPGSNMSLKKLIIMKLCNNDRYNEYVDFLEGNFKKMMQDDPNRHVERYQLFHSLRDYLASGEYKTHS